MRPSRACVATPLFFSPFSGLPPKKGRAAPEVPDLRALPLFCSEVEKVRTTERCMIYKWHVRSLKDTLCTRVCESESTCLHTRSQHMEATTRVQGFCNKCETDDKNMLGSGRWGLLENTHNTSSCLQVRRSNLGIKLKDICKQFQ